MSDSWLSRSLPSSHVWSLDTSGSDIFRSGNYSIFNPTTLSLTDSLQPVHRTLQVFLRVSNMHFCPPNAHWREVLQTEKQVRSFVAAGVLRLPAAEEEAPPVWLSAVRLLPLDHVGGDAECTGGIPLPDGGFGSFRGAEDPRVFQGVGASSHAPWLFVSAWTGGCVRLRMHLLKLRAEDGTPPDEAAPALPTLAAAELLPLTVRAWRENYGLPHPESEPIQKNWLPFVHRDTLLVEYSVEPRIVLRVDPASGDCYPAFGQSSFPRLHQLAQQRGRVSGGAPPVLLSERGVFLGLAHVKESVRKPHLTGTKHMVYRHLFYAFEAAPPYAVVAASEPFSLPRTERRGPVCDKGPPEAPPTVQFASGMVLDNERRTVLVSYSELDCGAKLAEYSLSVVLHELWGEADTARVATEAAGAPGTRRVVVPPV